jgi:signal transduction histidine kinase
MFLSKIKLALKKRRSIFVVFALTVLFPAVLLSILGLRGLRNEKYRLERQSEAENAQIADSMEKTVLSCCITEAERRLREIGGLVSPNKSLSFAGYESANELLKKDSLIYLAFIIRNTAEPFYFGAKLRRPSKPTSSPVFTPEQKTILNAAERAEFGDKDFLKAILFYERVYASVADTNLRAQLALRIGRCRFAMKDYLSAASLYGGIVKEFRDAVDGRGLPLDIAAGIRLGEIFLIQSEPRKALESLIEAYRSLLNRADVLGEEIFRAYTGLVENNIEACLSKNREIFTKFDQTQIQEYSLLRRQNLDKWAEKNRLEESIIPELKRLFAAKNESGHTWKIPIRISKTIDEKDYLAIAIPVDNAPGVIGAENVMIGASISEEFIIAALKKSLFGGSSVNGDSRLSISNLSGRLLLGSKPAQARPLQTVLFPESFPPWKIEFYGSTEGIFGVPNLGKNFYFWTVFLMLVVLISGTIFVVRAILRETELLDLKSDFVAAVSHDLKSPLASMTSLVERLQGGRVADPERLREYVSVIALDLGRLTRLVDRILDFAKAERGDKAYHFETTNIGDLVRREVATFEENKARDGLKVRVLIYSPIPLIDIDTDAIRQALMNLMENAVKFSPSEKDIEVEVSSDEAEVCISVSDKGVGIEPGEQDAIFEQFYQGKNARTSSSAGVGLGLSIVREVARAHGGRITVKSEPGRGSTFSLFFPIKNTN